VELEYRDGGVTGKMNMGGQEQPIAADLGGATFAEGAGALVAAGCLPLAEGYAETFRQFDIEKLKLKLVRLTVEGSETVTVPAGTFEAFKVEIASAEGGPDRITAWIAKDTRQPVKYSAVLAAAGGAIMNGELTFAARAGTEDKE
jgi:hypothetical protein